MLFSAPYPTTPEVCVGPLPDPFAWPDGSRVQTPEQWPKRGKAWCDLIVDLLYGGLPPAPERIEIETRCHGVMRRWDNAAPLRQYGVRCWGGAYPITLGVQLILPPGKGPFPVLLSGDGCWSYFTDAMQREVIDAGYALAIFNRTELAEDLVYGGCPDRYKRSGGLYDVYPEATGFGALSAWAWGYHRAVDLLTQLPEIDAEKIIVTGHSRGAKTVLLATATDHRIAAVHDNASCAAGAAVSRYVGHGGESLEIVRNLPSWFGRGLADCVDPAELPFDQHCLLAAIAPRPLLITFALDDRWSNPEGMVQCASAVCEVYRFLGAEDNFAYHLRPGLHFYEHADLGRMLEFLDWRWRGQPPRSAFNAHPYDHLPPAFDWRAPEVSP